MVRLNEQGHNEPAWDACKGNSNYVKWVSVSRAMSMKFSCGNISSSSL